MVALPTTAVVAEPLDILEWLSLSWRLPLLVIQFVTNLALLYLSPREVSRLGLRQKISLAYLKTHVAVFSLKQQALPRNVLSGPRIQKYCRWYRLQHRAVAVPLDAGGAATLDTGPGTDIPSPVLHFVTPSTAQPGGPTLFYIHGGGYHDPIIEDGHLPFVLRCSKACRAAQVVFLEYSLAPEHQYPSQLVQAVAGMRYLLEKESVKPDNLILGGDSAGGHLTLSLLAHITEPSPYAPPLDLHEGRFKAVMLVSPWLTMTDEQIKALRRVKHDYIPVERILPFRNFFKPNVNEVWSNLWQPQDAATVAIWKRLFNPGAICRKAIVAAGTEEVLFDSCVGFSRDCLGCESVVVDDDDEGLVERIKESDFVLAIAPGEAHVQPGLDAFLWYYEGRMMRALLAFLEAC